MSPRRAEEKSFSRTCTDQIRLATFCLKGPNLAGMYELSQTDCAKIVVWSQSGFWQIWKSQWHSGNTLDFFHKFVLEAFKMLVWKSGLIDTVWTQSGWSISRLSPDTLQNEQSQKRTSGRSQLKLLLRCADAGGTPVFPGMYTILGNREQGV